MKNLVKLYKISKFLNTLQKKIEATPSPSHLTFFSSLISPCTLLLQEGGAFLAPKIHEILSHLYVKITNPLLALPHLSCSLFLKYSPKKVRQLISILTKEDPGLLTTSKTLAKTIGHFAAESKLLEHLLKREDLKKETLLLLAKRLQFLYETGDIFPNFIKAYPLKSPETCLPKTPIHIVLILDKNYLSHTLVTMASALYYAKDQTFYVFHILTAKDELSEESKQRFSPLQALKNFELVFHEFPEHLIPKVCHEIIKKGSYPLLISYRLFLPQIFPDLDKIISLDSDLIIKKDLTSLWDTKLENCSIAGATDPMPEEAKKRLGMTETNAVYLNSGVLVMNLERMREKQATRQMLDALERHSNHIVLLEQDVINLALQNELKVLSPAWNVPVRALHHKKYLKYTVTPFWPAIIHFILIRKSSTEKKVKPWKVPLKADQVWKTAPHKIPTYFRDYWAFRDLIDHLTLAEPSRPNYLYQPNNDLVE